MLKQVTEWFKLTKNEQRVVLFLALTMLCGAGIKLFEEMFPSVQNFDYSDSDSTFTALGVNQENAEIAALSGEVKEQTIRRLDINTATREELMDLPGIGKVIAQRIIDYRRNSGKFSTVEELRAVKGISKNKLDRIKPMISLQ